MPRLRLRRCEEDDCDWRPRKRKRRRAKQVALETYNSDEDDIPLTQLKERLSQAKQKLIEHVCDVCQKSFKESSHLKSHKRSHIEKIKCDLCEHLFHPDGMKNHIQMSHVIQKQYECIFCDILFASANELKKHKNIHRRMDKRTLSCPDCDKTFTDGSKLNVHLRSHTGERPYICHLCQGSFTSKAHLSDHIRRVHLLNLYECDHGQCEAKFKKLVFLKVHIRKEHTGERPYVCETCLQCFFSFNHLKRHIEKDHLTEGNFKCSYCPKSFHRGDYFRIHERSHTGEKPYDCAICNLQFASTKQLKRHKETHNGTRFSCEKCGKTFGKQINCKQHFDKCRKVILKISKSMIEASFRCEICKRNFKKAEELEEHTCEDEEQELPDEEGP